MVVSIALVHYPVRDKRGDIAATSITNFDIHDLARTSRTYGVEPFYIITPMDSQKEFAKRIIRLWSVGFGAIYNPSRKSALETTVIVNDLGEVIDDFFSRGLGKAPLFVGTSAKKFPHTIGFKALREKLEKADDNFCIIFGTGWGLHPSLTQELDLMLEPIQGVGQYNHLSVRSAVAIICDRLLGR